MTRSPKGKALYRLTSSFPYLVNRIGTRIGDLFSQRLAPFGITLPMYRVLAALWERRDQRLSDLSEMTTVEISTLSRLIGAMKRKGLVTRRRVEENGRTVAINLTARGRALTEELIPIAIHFEEAVIRTRTPGDVAWLKKALAEAYESLDAIEAENILISASKPLVRRRHPRAASRGR